MITLTEVIEMKRRIKENPTLAAKREFISFLLALGNQANHKQLLDEANNIAAREFNKNFKRVEDNKQ